VKLGAWDGVFGIRRGGGVRERLMFLLLMMFDVRGWTMLGGLTSRHDEDGERRRGSR
jgi:hypothetical protein